MGCVLFLVSSVFDVRSRCARSCVLQMRAGLYLCASTFCASQNVHRLALSCTVLCIHRPHPLHVLPEAVTICIQDRMCRLFCAHRFCIGAPLAMAEMKVVLAVLARGYKAVADTNTEWSTIPMPQPKNGLPLTVARLQPAA